MSKKIRNDAFLMAKCGLTTRSRCSRDTAGLKECEDCKLVIRHSSRWKMIDRKPYRKCNRCGEFLPLERFGPKIVRAKTGVVYHTVECVCKRCRSAMYFEKKHERLRMKFNE